MNAWSLAVSVITVLVVLVLVVFEPVCRVPAFSCTPWRRPINITLSYGWAPVRFAAQLRPPTPPPTPGSCPGPAPERGPCLLPRVFSTSVTCNGYLEWPALPSEIVYYAVTESRKQLLVSQREPVCGWTEKLTAASAQHRFRLPHALDSSQRPL